MHFSIDISQYSFNVQSVGSKSNEPSKSSNPVDVLITFAPMTTQNGGHSEVKKEHRKEMYILDEECHRQTNFDL